MAKNLPTKIIPKKILKRTLNFNESKKIIFRIFEVFLHVETIGVIDYVLDKCRNLNRSQTEPTIFQKISLIIKNYYKCEILNRDS